MYRLFETEFLTPLGGLDTNQVWARDANEAERLCERRKLGEILVGPAAYSIKLATDWMEEQEWGQALHAAIWMGYVACRTGVCDGYSLTCEGGVLHDLAHLVINRGDQAAQDEAFARAYARLLTLQRDTPGFYRGPLPAIITGSLP